MKRVLCAVSIIVLLFILCSCDSKHTYVKQNAINFNYNNISAGASPYWIDNDVICFAEHSLGFDLYTINTQGKRKITTLSEPTDIQVYNNRLYYYETGISSKYSVIEHDLATGKKKAIATIHTEKIHQFYVVDEHLYVVTGENDTLTKNIVTVSLTIGKLTTVAQDVFACGIANGRLNYITIRDNEYNYYEYDAEGKQNSLLAKFDLASEANDEVSDCVNYCSESIILVSTDKAAKESIIYIYNYENNVLNNYKFKGLIWEFVAYDEYAYFSAESNLEDNASTETIYRFNIDEQEIDKITELKGYNDLFVGSDDDVYISSTDFDGVRCYSVDGNYENIILK